MINHRSHTAPFRGGAGSDDCASSGKRWSVNGWRMRPDPIVKRYAPTAFECGELADQVAALGLLQRTRAVSMELASGPYIDFVQVGGMLPSRVQLMKGPLYIAIGAYHHFSASRQRGPASRDHLVRTLLNHSAAVHGGWNRWFRRYTPST